MVEINVPLSVSGIERAIRELKQIENNLDKQTNKAVKKIAKRGTEILNNAIRSLPVQELDGNTSLGVARDVVIENNATIEWFGEDISYVEFGTGSIGEFYSYPLLNKIDWNYNSGDKIKESSTGKKYWFWFDKTGKNVTQGIPAYAPMYNMIEQLRRELYTHPERFFVNYLGGGR